MEMGSDILFFSFVLQLYKCPLSWEGREVYKGKSLLFGIYVYGGQRRGLPHSLLGPKIKN